mmetsp:Transcript_7918/g.9194  ORF Transcript_7918/g.9194 Transcript_7918/m.9194 type:complete len:188 (+) Transcript_7918:77-640(+)
MDIEEAELRQRLNRNTSIGPEAGSDSGGRRELYTDAALGLPPHHPINIIYRLSVMSGSIYGLHELDVFHQIILGPNIDHTWFKVGLAASVAIAAIKCYMEMFEGSMRKKKVVYDNYKMATHSVIVLFLLASFSFHNALWDQFGGGKTFLINILFGFGILLQFALLVPTWLQNIVTFVFAGFFIQEYQ